MTRLHKFVMAPTAHHMRFVHQYSTRTFYRDKKGAWKNNVVSVSQRGKKSLYSLQNSFELTGHMDLVADLETSGMDEL